MGKKLDALLGRTFKTSKFKALVNLAISRLAVFKNQRQARCSLARSDVVQLLNLGHHERALLRVEQVIKEQNMLDVFVMIDGYCLLLIERVNLIEQEKVCPGELNEAISSLLYAASRCGEFPELQEIRAVFTSRFGKEFVARAIELRNTCGVNPKMIQKLSTRQASLESRLKVLKDIAVENSIVLQLEEDSFVTAEDKSDINQKQNRPEPEPSADSGSARLGDDHQTLAEDIEDEEGFSGSMKVRKYRDVADAAQAAFKSAAYAAAAARAAVELSRSEPHDPDDQNSPNPRRRKVFDSDEPMITTVHPIQNYLSESEDEETHNENPAEKSKQIKNAVELKRSMSASSSDSAEDILNATPMSSDVLGQTKPSGKKIVFDESDEETRNEQTRSSCFKTRDFGFDMKPSLLTNEVLGTEKSNPVKDEDISEGSGVKLHYPSHKQIPISPLAGLKIDSTPRNQMAHSGEGSGMKSAPRLNIEKRPISVRNRRMRGY